MPAASPHTRLRQGAILLGGALAYLPLAAGPLDVGWTPLLLGLVALLVAIAGGRGDRAWPPAVALLVVGVAVGALRLADVDAPAALAAVPRHVPALADPITYTLGLGLLGALSVLEALSPGRRGGYEPGLG